MNLPFSLSPVFTITAFLTLSLYSQGSLPPELWAKNLIVIRRVAGPVVLDGLSNEAAWKDIQPLPVVMQKPNYGNPPSEKTEILVGFDNDFLYVVARCYDHETSKIQSPSRKRDYSGGATEWIALCIDTFNDRENALAFATTPSGLRWDAEILNDGQPRSFDDSPINRSWNAMWDVETVINEKGWFAEFRIPFTSLRFQDRAGRVTISLIASRYIARKNETIIFPAIEPKWGEWSSIKISRAHEVIMDGVHSRNPLYITPYVLGELAATHGLTKDATAHVPSNNRAAKVGLDIKYGMASNLTLDVTLNTDFAQVEADDYQVNMTRFSLFFPEKRLFFQERAGIFTFSLGGNNRLFYSRRVGIFEGKFVPIYGGVRLVGRIASWDLGFLDMQTASINELSSENFGIMRIRKRIFNTYSYIGAMITSRIGTDGSYNIAYGLDGNLRIAGDDYLLFSWAQTFDKGQDSSVASLDPACLRVAWERRTSRGLGFNLAYARAGKDFDPGIGFMERKNFEGFGNRLLYGWMPGDKSLLQSHAIFADGYVILSNKDGAAESAEFGPGWGFATKSGWRGAFAIKTYRERVWGPLSFSDDDPLDKTDVQPGNYAFQAITGQLQTPEGNLLNAKIDFFAGSFYDGRRVSFGVKPAWAISWGLSLSGWFQYNWANFPNRKHKYEARIAQLRLEATFSLNFSAVAFVQYNSALDVILANVQFRFNPREGHDLYLVYNQDFITDPMKAISPRSLNGNRVFMLKYSYMFNL